MNNLREITKEPYFLEKAGFVRREEETSDVVRWVWYEKTIESQVMFVVQVEFEMAISDDPFVKTSDNFSYSFNGVFLKVIEEQTEEEETLPNICKTITRIYTTALSHSRFGWPPTTV